MAFSRKNKLLIQVACDVFLGIEYLPIKARDGNAPPCSEIIIAV